MHARVVVLVLSRRLCLCVNRGGGLLNRTAPPTQLAHGRILLPILEPPHKRIARSTDFPITSRDPPYLVVERTGPDARSPRSSTFKAPSLEIQSPPTSQPEHPRLQHLRQQLKECTARSPVHCPRAYLPGDSIPDT